MKQIRIEADGAALKRAQDALGSAPKKLNQAVSRAINRALTAGRMQVVRETTSKFTVKSSDVKQAVSIFRSGAKSGNPRGEVRLSGENLPLRAFKHTPRTDDTTGSKRKTVTVSIPKSRKEKLLKAFKWKGHIFERTGIRKATTVNPKVHETIKKRYGVSVPGMAASRSQEVRERMQEVFEKRLDHEVEVILKGKTK